MRFCTTDTQKASGKAVGKRRVCEIRLSQFRTETTPVQKRLVLQRIRTSVMVMKPYLAAIPSKSTNRGIAYFHNVRLRRYCAGAP